jgi:DHA3 family macrolide efflux protein-like MFS transporter
MDDNSASAPSPRGWRTFLKLWAVESLSEFGTQITFFAITIWLVQVLYPRLEQRGDLAIALAAEGIAFALTGLAVTPFAGAWADRHDCKRTMVVMDLASGLVTLLLAGLVITQSLQLWMWIVLVVCLSMLSAFHSSAFSASYVMLLPSEHLPRASGMTNTSLAFTSIFSPVLAATIIALPGLFRASGGAGGPLSWLAQLPDGTALAVSFDAITFLAAAGVAALLFLPSPRRAGLVDKSGKMTKSTAEDIREGAQYILRRPPLLWLLSLFTVANLLLFPSVLIPLLLKFDLAADWSAKGFSYEAALAVLTTTVGVAGLAWGSIITAWGGLKRRRVYAIVIPLLIAGVAQVALGLSRWLYVSAAMVFLLVGMGAVMGAHMAAIWQTQTPREMQGRVSAFRRLVVQAGAPLGTALAGLAAGILDPGLLIAVFGCLIALYCVAQLFNPQLRHVEDKEYLDRIAERAETRASSPSEL